MRRGLPSLLDLPLIIVLATVYLIAAKIGLKLAFVHASASAVWPPAGIALAAALLLGYRVWPGVFFGAFLANLTTEGTVLTSTAIGLGNSLEALLGAFLVNRFARGRDAFERPQDIVKVVLVVGAASTVSATFGVTSLSLAGFAPWDQYGSIWQTWWLGDTVGALIVTPVLLLWSRHPRVRWDSARVAEAVLSLASLIIVGQLVFGGLLPLAFLATPALVWVAFRFSKRETATAALILSALAIWGTLRGVGPFGVGPPNESLLRLEVFLGVTTVLAMIFAAVVAENRRGEEMRSRLASIVETSNDAIIGETLDGTILSWNAGAQRLYGYAPEEVIGRRVDILAPADRQDEVARNLERLRRGERVEPFETMQVRKDGTEIAVSLTISPVMDGRGRILGASAIARDVTERKRAEEAARRTEALLSVTRLANSAAHEINNPLMVISGQLELLALGHDDASQSRKRVIRALESATRIHEIVDRMKHITKLERANQPADLPERLDLGKSTSESEKEKSETPR
ncbi:MAG TPA: MASE1 domain-containing protein [Methylomirabilota bacterium]|nr:MASE1 domain-containing protein [Methylomirabilota bacterium]